MLEYIGRTVYILRTGSQRAHSIRAAMKGGDSDLSNNEWGGRIWYLMATVGVATGIGNYWRLPWQTFKVECIFFF